ncbi:MAG: DUF3737 family protein [Clostridia bacterium]|nr:DUF3737 family protein [Clostridia bacterium]
MNTTNRIKVIGQTFDEERALYNLTHGDVENCTFAGPADGESVLKEARDVRVKDCTFSLRYPLWHAKGFTLEHSTMDDLTRAPIWYAEDGTIADSTITGVKCLRECDRMRVVRSTVSSPEFGWRCRGLAVQDSTVDAVYCMFESRDVEIKNLKMTGKYSFQYIENLHIVDSYLDTKDAFWHTKNAFIENTTLKGEYLGWYSEGLTLVNCTIIGTQPLCYCKNLKLIGCKMIDCDLSFENSHVMADVVGEITSVKNPLSGRIVADGYGEIILEGNVAEEGYESKCTIEVRQ